MKRIFVQADQSGAEALIVSYLCRPGKFRDLFIHGIKPHVFVALHSFDAQLSRMPGVETKTLANALLAEPKDLRSIAGWGALEQIIKDTDKLSGADRLYATAKMVCHASNYNIKARALRLNILLRSGGEIALALPVVEKLLNSYHGLFPEIRDWHSRCVLEVKRTGMLRNLFGHPRVFTGEQDESVYKDWFAFVPQSTVGQITNMAFTEAQEEIFSGKHPEDIDVVENNHDSLLAQCLEENKLYTAQLLASKLNRELVSPSGDKFKMRSEVQWSSKSWGEMEEIKL